MLCTVYLLQQALCLLDMQHRSAQKQEIHRLFWQLHQSLCCQAQHFCLESINITLISAQGTPCSRWQRAAGWNQHQHCE